MKRKLIYFFLFFFILMIIFFIKSKLSENKIALPPQDENNIKSTYSSNIIKDISYNTKDLKGNEYMINATEGVIDINNNYIIFLTNVKATIVLKDTDSIIITSNYGKYNMNSFDTIFSKNVIVEYLDNIITGENLDFSLDRDSIIISKNVTYTNNNNILKADAANINTTTKDIKIFMYTNNEKVNIKNLN